MTRKQWFAIGLAVALIIPGLVFGQAKVGTTGVNFLKIGVSSRAVAMADAFLAIADDASALYYNPAGLVNIKKKELIFTHVAFPSGLGVNFDYIGGVMPLPMYGAAVGASMTALYTDDMPVTTYQLPYGNGQTFRATDFAAAISYSQRLTDKFSVGGSVKYIQENLADENALGWAVDVGTFYDTGWKSLRIAMLISNFGPDMQHVTTPFPLPQNFKFATAVDLMQKDDSRLTMGLEGTHPNDNSEEVHLGFEYAFKETAMLRFGKKINGWKRSSNEEYVEDKDNNPFYEYPVFDEEGMVSFSGMSFGGGLYMRNIGLKVDYTYATIQYLGGWHRFSLGYVLK
ncbi:PorV/PorQ family protein [bacterium]|nr:PorV/PorQ family protein [bacterium]